MNAPKTLLLVTLEYPPQIGGIANYLAHLAERCPEGSVRVLAPEYEGSHDFDMRASVPVFRRPMTSRFLRPRWLPAAYWTWWLCRRERPDAVVVSHLLNMGRVALGMHRTLGIPYIVILHGMDVAMAASGGVRKKAAAREILASASHVVANSRYTAGWARSFGVPEERISVVNPPPSMPLETAVTKRRADEFRSKHGLGKSFVVLSAGRLVERKGFDTCIEAVARMRDEGRDVSYVVVGDGPHREALERQVEEAGLGEAARFLGVVDSSELSVAYAAADAFVMVPRSLGSDIEGFGIVYLEANLMGTPVVGSRSGGVTDAVIDGETGLLVAPGDGSELYGALSRLMDSPTLRKRLVEGGKARLQRDYGDNRQARKFYAAVREAVGQ